LRGQSPRRRFFGLRPILEPEEASLSLSVYQSSVGAFQVSLPAFSLILDKAVAYAEQAKFDPVVYMGLRLRPNMLPFSRQVQNFCDSAKNVSARLAAVEAPRFEDNEASIGELKARIEKTLAFLATVDKAAIEAGAAREIVFPIGPQKAQMRGDNYLLHFALPNYYFHLTTAYDLLRHAGVEIGKRDYLGAVPGIAFI
jgi:hypothetical protein